MKEPKEDFLTRIAREQEPEVCKPGEENKEMVELKKRMAKYMREVVNPQVRKLERLTAAELYRRRMRGW